MVAQASQSLTRPRVAPQRCASAARPRTVVVEAESLYEAAELAMRLFKLHDCEPGEISKLEIEVRSSITHTVTPKKVRQGLDGGAKTPKEAVMKERYAS
jgi:hypothetical protein